MCGGMRGRVADRDGVQGVFYMSWLLCVELCFVLCVSVCVLSVGCMHAFTRTRTTCTHMLFMKFTPISARIQI